MSGFQKLQKFQWIKHFSKLWKSWRNFNLSFKNPILRKLQSNQLYSLNIILFNEETETSAWKLHRRPAQNMSLAAVSMSMNHTFYGGVLKIVIEQSTSKES
jgi:hypothetical protein